MSFILLIIHFKRSFLSVKLFYIEAEDI